MVWLLLIYLFLDAQEKAKLDIHAALRDACCQGDVNSVSSLLSSLSKDAGLIVNMAPSGASTLLFMYILYPIINYK